MQTTLEKSVGGPVSKIARLPKATRDRLNQLLLDGLPYSQILDQLGPDVAHINEQNISAWKHGGHQQWLQEQTWREEMHLQSESFSDLASGTDPIQLPESGLQLAAIGICQLLRFLCAPGAEPDPDKYVRVANSLARLSRSILHLQEYRDRQARAKTAELKQRDTSKPGTETEKQILVDHWRAFFGHDLSEVPPPEPAAPPQPAPTQVLPQPEPVRQNGQSADPNNSDSPDEHMPEPPNPPREGETAPALKLSDSSAPPAHEPAPAEPTPSANEPDSPLRISDFGLRTSTSLPLAPAAPAPGQCHCAECGEFIGRATRHGYRPIQHCPGCGTPL